jgi:exodeoxyribonuclease III
MRVVTYNIKTGGYDGSDSTRLDAVLRVVAGLAPDVLALQELRGFDRPRVATRIAAALGMRAFLARSWFGQPVGVFVRAGLPVLTSGPVRRPFHHAACRVEVGTDHGPLTVVSAHLNPHWPGPRRREAGRVAAAVRGRSLALVCGDLNGLDPWTDHTDRVRRLAPPHRVRHLRWDGSVDTRAVATLDRAGLVDLYPGSGRAETVPTGLGGAEFSGMRLDYLFGTPAVAARLRSYRVVEGGEVDKASDHHPVLVELDL